MDIPGVRVTDFELAQMPVLGQGRQPLFPKASNFLAKTEERYRQRTPGSSLIELAKMMQIG